MISIYETRRGRKRVTDPCDMCEAANVTESCNKCCTGVCDAANCCMKFPHYHNTNFVICTTCTNDIDRKLILLIDLGKLRLLKKKISANETVQSIRSARSSMDSTKSFENVEMSSESG
jgi:hypothetical protein